MVAGAQSPIAQGRTAQVYAWGGQAGAAGSTTGWPGGARVLKLFRPGWPRAAAEREARVGQIVHRAGAGAIWASPRVDAIVQVDGRFGVLYERVAGPSMLQALAARPWRLPHLARRCAALHVAMHRRPGAGLPAQRAALERAITGAPGLSPTARRRALAALAALPDGDRVCHGDFHPDNVILAARGPVIIDWGTATQGNPLADVARTSLLLTIGAVPPGTGLGRRRLIAVARRLFRATYLGRYLELTRAPLAQVEAWRIPVAAARLSEGIRGEADRLVALVERAAGEASQSMSGSGW